ncbi:MAG TPA: hypothetical protein DD490_33220 [Acidobacteria bacterium]|nr:hypothetical protein [Acidobacteriota bacterium]
MRRGLQTIVPLTLGTLWAATLLAPHPVHGAASDRAVNEQSQVRLITPYRTAPPDGEVRLGLHFKLAPGWHVYWKNSGDAGFPPVVVFGETPGLSAPELLWPAPERFELPGDLVAFGYADEVVYPLRTRRTAGPGTALSLSADVDYLVCDDEECLPYRYTLKLDQPLAATGPAEPDPATEPLVTTWWNRVPVSAEALAGVTTSAALVDRGTAGPALEVRVDGVQSGTSPGLFLESHEAFDTGRPEAGPTEEGVVLRVPLRPKVAGQPLPKESSFAWTVTGLLHEGRPVSVEARQTVPLRAGTPQEPTGGAASSPARPVLTALGAAGALLLALWLWGLLAPRTAPETRPGREAWGFVSAAAVLGLLYVLSRQVTFEGLAWIELSLLAMALCAWLRRRAASRPALRHALGLGLLVCTLAVLWLAGHNRLP